MTKDIERKRDHNLCDLPISEFWCRKVPTTACFPSNHGHIRWTKFSAAKRVIGSYLGLDVFYFYFMKSTNDLALLLFRFK